MCAAPHIGHFYTLVLTDILKRWQVLQGRKAILCTGTDEHGMKVIDPVFADVLCSDRPRYKELLLKQIWTLRSFATRMHRSSM